MNKAAHDAGPRVTIVVPTCGTAELTLICLQSLEESQPYNSTQFEVVVVDDGSDAATLELLSGLTGDVRLLRTPAGAAAAAVRNQGAETSGVEFVLFLGGDTAVVGSWLDVLVAAMDEDERRGAAQAKVLRPDGGVGHAGGLVFQGGFLHAYGRGHRFPDAPALDVRRAPDSVSGSCLIVRREAFAATGGYHPAYSCASYADADLSFALRAAGWTLLYEPAAVVISLEQHTDGGTGAPGGEEEGAELDRARFATRWAADLSGRPPLHPAEVESWAHRPQGGWGPGEGPSAVAEGQRILVIDPFPPLFDRASGGLRTLEVEKALRAMGHAVVHEAAGAAPERQRYARHLSRWGVRLHGEDPGAPGPVVAGEAVHRPRHPEDSFDLVVVGPWEVAEQLLPAVRRHFPSAAVVVDSCDLHFVREQRGATHPPAVLEERRRRELAVYAAADLVLVVSEVEQELLARHLPRTRSVVVGNAHVARDETPTPSRRRGVVFVGNANHTPNVEGARWFVEEVWPEVLAQRPEAVLSIVGNDPQGAFSALAGPTVEVTGWVPTTRPHLESARVSVAPLLSGAGVKGKVGEALSVGLPVVSTTIGAEGLGLTDGLDVQVADSVEGFAQRIVLLLDDDEVWAAQSEAGLARSREALGPERLAAQLRSALEALADPPAIGRPVVLLVESDVTASTTDLVADLTATGSHVVRLQLSHGPAAAPQLAAALRKRAVDVVVFVGHDALELGRSQLVVTAREGGAVTVVVLDDDAHLLLAPHVPASHEAVPDAARALARRTAERALAGADVLVVQEARLRQLVRRSPSLQRARLVLGPAARWWRAVASVLGDTRPPERPAERTGPEISVVIGTYDRPEALAEALEGFCRQTLVRDRFEVIVVDDASPVPVADVVERFADRLDVRCTRRDVNGGVGPARATGVSLARAPLVLCFDDDLHPRPRLLAEHLRSHAANPGLFDVVLGFLGAGRGLLTSNVTFAVTQTLRTYTSFGDLEDGQVLPWHFAWGGCSSYKTELIRVHEMRMPWMEDMELAWRLRDHGLRVVFNRHAAMVSDDEMTIEGFRARSAKHGRAQVAISTLHDAEELVRHFRLDDLRARYDSVRGGRLQQCLSTAEALVGIPRAVLEASPARGGTGPGRSEADVLDDALEVVFEEARLAAAVSITEGAGAR